MTCQELRSHFEDLKGRAARQQPDSAEVAAHTAICAACGQFIEAQGELAAGLRLLRESAPEIPTTLDATALANYGAFAARAANAARVKPRRISLIAAAEWAAAVVVAMIIAGVALRLFFPSEEISNAPTQVTTPQARSTAQSPAPPAANAPQSNANRRHPAVVAKAKWKSPAENKGASRNIAKSEAPKIVPTNSADPAPVGFRSLMYCDALSCGGPMEMIRVQLPPSAAGLAPAWSQSNGIVYADVLVGPDGIARGIRIVQ